MWCLVKPKDALPADYEYPQLEVSTGVEGDYHARVEEVLVGCEARALYLGACVRASTLPISVSVCVPPVHEPHHHQNPLCTLAM
jgi:hypothetical protein